MEGDLLLDELTQVIYSTDASAYKETPLGVAFPKNTKDIQTLVRFANDNHIGLIPRAAGTSLAGQVVGAGLIVDISRYMTKIQKLDTAAKFVWVEPGVIRDELNAFLNPHGLLYGPETSTSNRCMIGGMVGNNSCGSRSLIFGSAREHLLEAEVVLSDGKVVTLGPKSDQEIAGILNQKHPSSERALYQWVFNCLSSSENRAHIQDSYPLPEIPRRNTGYALDLVAQQKPFNPTGPDFNLCSLLAGSEGTLGFITRLKLNLEPVLPPHQGVVAIHFDSVDASLRGNLIALKQGPTACELMDHFILECTKSNPQQFQNRFFISGDPQALLIVEFCETSEALLIAKREALEKELRAAQLGYHFPLITGSDIKRVWDLRKAGLGLLSNIPGDAKPAPVIEDTAVKVDQLPKFIRDFNTVLEKRGLSCVHYAHAATGELHLRPILNLKTKEGNAMFRTIALDIAALVKSYRGSLSGEHGDGRLRGEFISFMYGEKITSWFEELKHAVDPKAIFNPGKIVHTPSMNESLRVYPGQPTPHIPTLLNFDAQEGFIRAIESCNGSGDCRKTEITGGTMCPSYMASREEKDTTRARANVLREVLNGPQPDFSDPKIKDVLDLCISCKGCKSECPSNVDMAKIKAEVLHQQMKAGKVSLRTYFLAHSMALQGRFSKLPWLYNLGQRGLIGYALKKVLGIAPQRTLPLISPQKRKPKHTTPTPQPPPLPQPKLLLWVDEFTALQEPELAQKSVELLARLGYEVAVPKMPDSGRTFISKGYLEKAQRQAQLVWEKLKPYLEQGYLVVGLEPSAILSFRDEYVDFLGENLIGKFGSSVMLIEEFLAKQFDEGAISSASFDTKVRRIRVHGHCHQKAISSESWTKRMLLIPAGNKAVLIPSGCCGMAGSFGYEKEHYSMSMKIGELVLFPTVRAEEEHTLIAAPGTSCRHQIADGTGKKAQHPIEILFDCLKV